MKENVSPEQVREGSDEEELVEENVSPEREGDGSDEGEPLEENVSPEEECEGSAAEAPVQENAFQEDEPESDLPYATRLEKQLLAYKSFNRMKSNQIKILNQQKKRYQKRIESLERVVNSLKRKHFLFGGNIQLANILVKTET